MGSGVDSALMSGSWFFHYTTRDAAQHIAAAGFIRPGPSGRVWLTWDIFSHGHQARQALALNRGPIDVLFAIDTETVRQVAMAYGDPKDHLQPSAVRPIRLGGAGQLMLSGGGAEVTVGGPVPVNPIRVLGLSAP